MEYVLSLNIGRALQVYFVTVAVYISLHASDMFALEISKASLSVCCIIWKCINMEQGTPTSVLARFSLSQVHAL